ncbi:hypothetical protein TMatcc_006572 [Talaromyces marneffei ATCC 18224]
MSWKGRIVCRRLDLLDDEVCPKKRGLIFNCLTEYRASARLQPCQPATPRPRHPPLDSLPTVSVYNL